MEALCVQIFDAGLTQHTRRTAEVESFFTCSREAVADNQHKAAQIAADFENTRWQVGFFLLRQTRKVRHQLNTSKFSQMKFCSIAEVCGNARDHRRRTT